MLTCHSNKYEIIYGSQSVENYTIFSYSVRATFKNIKDTVRHKYKEKLVILQSIGIIVIKNKETRVVTYTCSLHAARNWVVGPLSGYNFLWKGVNSHPIYSADCSSYWMIPLFANVGQLPKGIIRIATVTHSYS